MKRISWPVLAVAALLAGSCLSEATAASVSPAFAQRQAATVQRAKMWHGYQVRRYSRQPQKYTRPVAPPQPVVVRNPAPPVVQPQQATGGPRY